MPQEGAEGSKRRSCWFAWTEQSLRLWVFMHGLEVFGGMVRLANFPAVRWSLTSFSINYNSLVPEPTPRRNKTLRQFVDSALYTCFSDHFRPFFGDSETRVREIHARASFCLRRSPDHGTVDVVLFLYGKVSFMKEKFNFDLQN